MASPPDRSAPMASAPMKYDDTGQVDWGNMWDSFCELPRNGGPAHRATRLEPGPAPDPADPAYQQAQAEIMRGIAAVCGFPAAPAQPGWIALTCPSAGMAHWLRGAIEEENVAARWDDLRVLVPVGAHYTLKGEIKNVITAVAKTTHYWADHVPPDVARALEAQVRLERVKAWVGGLFGRRGPD